MKKPKNFTYKTENNWIGDKQGRTDSHHNHNKKQSELAEIRGCRISFAAYAPNVKYGGNR